MKESGIQKKIIDALRKKGCFVTKLHGGPMQRAGLPDILCVHRGLALFFEVKTPGEEETALQAHTMKKIREAGGKATVVRSVEEAVATVG